MKFNSKDLKNGEPCDHPGCLNHITHPCEGCGRIGGISKKTIRLYKWPRVNPGSCKGCYFGRNCSPTYCNNCGFSIFKLEKPDFEFIDVEIEEEDTK